MNFCKGRDPKPDWLMGNIYLFDLPKGPEEESIRFCVEALDGNLILVDMNGKRKASCRMGDANPIHYQNVTHKYCIKKI